MAETNKFTEFTDEELLVFEDAIHDRCSSEYELSDTARSLLGEVVEEKLNRIS